MDRTRKLTNAIFAGETPSARAPRPNRCSVCGKGFKSKSHFDAICNLCWADNEMRPYIAASSRRFYVN